MKYAVNFNKESTHAVNHADEIIITNWDQYKQNLEAFIKVIKQHEHQRIIIQLHIESWKDLYDDKWYHPLDNLMSLYKNLVICAICDYAYHPDDLLEIDLCLAKRNLSHFFQHAFKTPEELHTALFQFHVTDVYISDWLAFCVKDIRTLIDNLETKPLIRVYPNISQCGWQLEGIPLCSFFIRPEDTKVYDDYVDVFDLSYDIYNNKPRTDVLYKIYATDQFWLGKLSNLILNFKDTEIDNRCIPGMFAQRRVLCNKRCLLKPESCMTCYEIPHYAQVLKERYILSEGEDEDELLESSKNITGTSGSADGKNASTIRETNK